MRNRLVPLTAEDMKVMRLLCDLLGPACVPATAEDQRALRRTERAAERKAEQARGE